MFPKLNDMQILLFQKNNINYYVVMEFCLFFFCGRRNYILVEDGEIHFDRVL